MLGIGAGEVMNTKPFGIKWDERTIRSRRLREYIAVVKLSWHSTYEHPANFNGEFYDLVESYLSCVPFQKSTPPIYIGAFSSKALLQLVGESADGWFPASYHTVAAFRERVQIIKEAAACAKRPTETIDVMANIPVITCDDEGEIDRVKKVVETSLKRELLTSQYLFRDLGPKREEFAESLRDLEYQLAIPGPRYDKALQEAIGRLSINDEIMEHAISEMMAISRLDDCIDSIDRFIRCGATHIFFSSLGASRENFSRIAEEIIPRLSRKTEVQGLA